MKTINSILHNLWLTPLLALLVCTSVGHATIFGAAEDNGDGTWDFSYTIENDYGFPIDNWALVLGFTPDWDIENAITPNGWISTGILAPPEQDFISFLGYELGPGSSPEESHDS
jgi:hypothetical protein